MRLHSPRSARYGYCHCPTRTQCVSRPVSSKALTKVPPVAVKTSVEAALRFRSKVFPEIVALDSAGSTEHLELERTPAEPSRAPAVDTRAAPESLTRLT